MVADDYSVKHTRRSPSRGLFLFIGSTFMAGVVGWLLMFSVLDEISTRLSCLESERSKEVGIFRSVLRAVETKLDAVALMLRRVEDLSKPSSQGANVSNQLIERLEGEISELREQTDTQRRGQQTSE